MRFAVSAHPAIGSMALYSGERKWASMSHRIRCGRAFTGDFLKKLRRRAADECEVCSMKDNIQHVILSCDRYDVQRRKLFESVMRNGFKEITMRSVCDVVNASHLVTFLQEAEIDV